MQSERYLAGIQQSLIAVSM